MSDSTLECQKPNEKNSILSNKLIGIIQNNSEIPEEQKLKLLEIIPTLPENILEEAIALSETDISEVIRGIEFHKLMEEVTHLLEEFDAKVEGLQGKVQKATKRCEQVEWQNGASLAASDLQYLG